MQLRNLHKFGPVIGKVNLVVENWEALNNFLKLSPEAIWEYEYSEEYSILYEGSTWYFSTYLNGTETREELVLNVNFIPEF